MDLNVTPEIANNGVVQLKVDIKREFLGAIREDGTASPHSRSAHTKVMVKSGQTAVIGGIYQNVGSQLETGVPFLKDIPIIGFLFRGRIFHKDKTELLLFLTPRVLSQAGSSNMGEGVSSSALGKENGSTLE
jgi:type IV pilus assembly protein PilQ